MQDPARSVPSFPRALRHGVAFALAAIPCAPATVVAQAACTLAFAPGDALAGVDGPVRVLERWDPDGPGPAPVHVVVAGRFEVAGAVVSPNIAAYEPVARQWVALSPGLPADVVAVAARPNGNLLATSTTAAAVFEWNGTVWQQLGGSFGGALAGPPRSLAVMPNGDVVAGGPFTLVAGAPIHGVARWDGSTWQPMGAPTVPWSLGSVDRLEPLPNGDLIATELFTQIGGVACSLIARWDGTTWHPLGAGSTTLVYSFAVATSGDVVAAGTFATATGPASIARWNGAVWTDVGAGVPLTTGLLAPLPNDEVVLIGATGPWASAGTTWQPFAPWPTNPPPIDVAYALPGGELLAGGDFPATPAVPAHRFARWNGMAWQAANPGSNGVIGAVAALPGGGCFAGGSFSAIGGVAANRLARFDGAAWHPIASSAIGTVRHAVARPNGEVVVVGEFPNASTGGMDFVARWNGGAVTPVYPGLWGARVVRALAVAGNGDVWLGYLDFAGFQTGVARWDGTTLTFTPLPGGIAIYALAELPDGALVLSGAFTVGGSNVNLVRWDGTSLTRYGTHLGGSIVALAVAPDGSLIAGGAFSAPARIARWDGAAWQAFGAGLTDSVTSIAALPDGDVIACERRTVGYSTPQWASRVWHWHAGAWTLRADTIGQASAVWSPEGTVALYGEFRQAGGAVNAYFARLRPTCPALVTDLGGGCVGAAGPVVLRVVERAWLGGSLRTAASGLPASAASIGVFGFAPVLQPLAQLHPLGAPGCYLLTTDDILLQFTVTGGAALPDLPVPNTPALVGGQFLHQLLGVELDAAGHPTAITSSNALLLTVGAL